MTTIDTPRAPGPLTEVDPQAVTDLRSQIAGPVITAADPDYETARRVWNGNIDRRPLLVVRCSGVADVQRAVAFAGEHDLLLSVRGGGHSAPGYGTNDGGMVIDLSALKGIRVDPGARTATAQGGVLWRDFDRETQAFGLATTGGTVSNTGIAGLTLGGGLGWLMGSHGLTVDNLLAADIVTADGAFRTVDPDHDPELFWAIRGGGGNFGLVTSFQYRLHPVGTVLGGMVVWGLDQAPAVLRFYRELCAGLPDEAECFLAMLTDPASGQPVVAMLVGYNGPLAEGERVFAAARSFGTPVADLVGPMPYGVRQQVLDEPNAVPGLHRYWRSAFTEQMPDELIDAMVGLASRFSSPLSAILFAYMHGAATRVPSDATAFAARRTQWDVDLIGQWIDGAESDRHIDWLRTAWQQCEPHLLGSAYVNHLADDDPAEKVRASYGSNHERLRRIKGAVDPANRFRVNANISPG